MHWPRVVASGALWMVVYNLLWGAAWFRFMEREWREAAAAIGRPQPFGAEVWFVMIALSLPMGVAIMAYTAGRPRSAQKSGLKATLALWVLMTMGMAGWGWQESLSVRVIALDSIVNLAAMAAASLAGVWSQREA